MTIKLRRTSWIKIYCYILTIFLVIPSNPSFAQTNNTPATLTMPAGDYAMPALKGLRFDPNNPLKLEFIIDCADKGSAGKEEAAILIKYFLAGLTTPQQDLWVNLSPYEKNKIIPESLGYTDLGKDMLNEDYILKKISASMTYPESEAGKKYWQETSTGNVTKVWVTPGEADLYEKGNCAYITNATLKVQTDNDYRAMQGAKNISAPKNIEAFKKHVLPLIEKEINHGKHFANLRQIYNALILAIWFKQKFYNTFYASYIDKNKVTGIDITDKNMKEKIYGQYLEAFTKGSYDYTKTERSDALQKITKKHYFSGGVSMRGLKPKRAQRLSIISGALVFVLASIGCAQNKSVQIAHSLPTSISKPVKKDLPERFDKNISQMGEDERIAIELHEYAQDSYNRSIKNKDRLAPADAMDYMYEAGFIQTTSPSRPPLSRLEADIASDDIKKQLLTSDYIKRKVQAGLEARITLPDGVVRKIMQSLSSKSPLDVFMNMELLSNLFLSGLIKSDDINNDDIDKIVHIFDTTQNEYAATVVGSLIKNGRIDNLPSKTLAYFIALAKDEINGLSETRLAIFEALTKMAQAGALDRTDTLTDLLKYTDIDSIDLRFAAQKSAILTSLGILEKLPQTLVDELSTGLSDDKPFIRYRSAEAIGFLSKYGLWKENIPDNTLSKLTTSITTTHQDTLFSLRAFSLLLEANLVRKESITKKLEDGVFYEFFNGGHKARIEAARALVALSNISSRVGKILRAGKFIENIIDPELTPELRKMPLSYRLQLYRRLGRDTKSNIFGAQLEPMYRVVPLSTRERLLDAVVMDPEAGIPAVDNIIRETIDSFPWHSATPDQIRNFADGMHGQIAKFQRWEMLNELDMMTLFYFEQILAAGLSVGDLRDIYKNKGFQEASDKMGHMGKLSLADSILDIFQSAGTIPDADRIGRLAQVLTRIRSDRGNKVIARKGAALYVTAHEENMFNVNETVNIFSTFVEKADIHTFKAKGNDKMIQTDGESSREVPLAEGKNTFLSELGTMPFNPNGNIVFMDHHGSPYRVWFNNGQSGEDIGPDDITVNTVSVKEITRKLLARAARTNGDLSDMTFFTASCYSGSMMIEVANELEKHIANGTIKKSINVVTSNQRNLVSWYGTINNALRKVTHGQELKIADIYEADELVGADNYIKMSVTNTYTTPAGEVKPYYGQNIYILQQLTASEYAELIAIVDDIKKPRNDIPVPAGILLPNSHTIGMMGNEGVMENFIDSNNDQATAEFIPADGGSKKTITLNRDHNNSIAEDVLELLANMSTENANEASVLRYIMQTIESQAPPAVYSFNTTPEETRNTFGFSPKNINAIALHKKVMELPPRVRAVAALHEKMHNLINRGILGLGIEYGDNGNPYVTVYDTVNKVQAGKIQVTGEAALLTQHRLASDPDYRDHYLLRALQLQLFGEADTALTDALYSIQSKTSDDRVGGIDLTEKKFAINVYREPSSAAQTINSLASSYDHLTLDAISLKDITRQQAMDMLQ